MARVFRGEGHHKVDGKGRVSIPAQFRRVLESGDPEWTEGLNPRFVIVYGDHRRNYLECFTMEAAAEVSALIATMPRASRERRALERLMHGQSLEATVDETGRIVLPAKLRAKIGVENELFFMGTGDTFQIWEPKTFEGEFGDDEWLDEMGDDFDILTLLPDPAPTGAQ